MDIIITGVGVAGRGVEAARLQPRDAVCVTIDWPLAEDQADDQIRSDIVMALSRALAACGTVAFRHDGPLPDGAGYYPPDPPTLMERVLAAANLAEPSFGVAVATSPSAISAMFAFGGWSYAVQAALVFDPATDPGPIVAALRQGLDWRGRVLPDGARLLFGPGHDGDFAVLAASDQKWLDRFRDAVNEASR